MSNKPLSSPMSVRLADDLRAELEIEAFSEERSLSQHIAQTLRRRHALRDDIAARVLPILAQRLEANTTADRGPTAIAHAMDKVAGRAYAYADAMLKARTA